MNQRLYSLAKTELYRLLMAHTGNDNSYPTAGPGRASLRLPANLLLRALLP